MELAPTDMAITGTTLIMATQQGLFRSINDGDSWTNITPVPTLTEGAGFIGVLADASTTLAFSFNGAVLRSTNSGSTWQKVFQLPGVSEARFVQGNGTIFLATRSNGIYYSNDNGITWRFMQGSVNALALRETFSCTATDTDILVGVPCWYGTNCNGIYKTSYTALPSSNEAFSLSGNAGAPALVTLNRPFGTPLTTTASATGEYSFPGVTDGAYTVVPTLADHTFTPTNASVTISGGNQSGINFTARAGAPAAPVGSFAFLIPASPLGSTSLTLSWNPPAGGAAGYTIVLSESLTAPAGTPQQGDVFTGDAAFNGMTMPPFNGQVVYDGAATTVTITGLTPNTRYSAVAYPYNGSGGARSYFVQTPATASAQTLDIVLPPVNVSVGSITLVPAVLNFGDVPRGTSYTRSYMMNYANLTTATISLTPPAAWEISVGNAAFSAAPVLWATVATVGQVNVRARFTPSLNGTFSGDITHSAGSTSAMVRVGGSSTPPSITVSTLTLNFGFVAPSSTATKAYRVSYRNLVTRSITLTPPTGFTISTSTTGTFSSVPLTVSTRVTGSFNVYVQFIPTALGKQSGTLQNDNFDAGTIALFVEGEGVYPTVMLSRSDLDFGGVPQGTCKTLSYTLTPAGGVSWQETQICPPTSGNVQISTTGPNGPFTSSCRSVIFARVGGVRSQQVWVRYCPTTDADLDEIITHTTEPGGLEERLFLTGFGARPDITVLNPTINFGTINLGATASAILRVRYGNVTLPGNIKLSTTSTHPFTFDNSALGTTNATLTTSATATGATFSVVVKFTPTVAGLFTNTFTAALAAANGTTTDTFTFTGRANGAAITANNNQTLNFNGNFLLTPNTRSFPLRYDNITTNTIEISPTAHPAFLLMDPQTGVFSTTAGITLTVGGTAANPVSSTSTLFVRFLPLRGGATSATLTFISAPMGGSTSASETLKLSGSGLAPYLNVTQGTVQFGQIDLGQTRYYGYSMTYRNITASTISVAVPAAADFSIIAQGQTITTATTAVWTTAGQTLTLSTVQPATTATTEVQLWLRYTPTIAQATTVTLTHLADGGDPRTVDSDNLVLTAKKPSVLIELTPKTLDFGTVGVNGSSTQTFSLLYQNVGSPITLTLPSGINARLASVGNFTSGSFSFTPPNFSGTIFVELQYSPTAAETLNRNVSCITLGTTATLVTARGRATTAQIFSVSPSTIAFTSALPPLNRATHIARMRYVIEVSNVPNVSVPNTQIRLTTTDGFSVEYVQGQGEYDAPAGIQNTALTSAVFLRRSTTTRIYVILRARYNNAATLTGTVRHDIVQDGNVLATVNLPVTVNFVECPGRVDTIRVMAVYTAATRQHLAENNTSVNKIIRRGEQYMPRVFTNSGIPNVYVKFVNPDGDLVTEVPEAFSILETVNDQVQIPGTRLFALRESFKADMICVFNISNVTRSSGVNATPRQEATTFAVDVRVPVPRPDTLQHSLAPEALPYVILHELGHICGGEHEDSPFTYGFGQGSSPDANGFRYTGQRIVYLTTSTIETFFTGTIMFHGGGVNGPVDPSVGRFASERIPYWSNPNITVTVPDEALMNGVVVPTPRQVTIGNTATSNMTRVMQENGPAWANNYTEPSPNLVLTGPTQVRVGDVARFDASACTGTPPFLYQWTIQTMLGGAAVNAVFSNNNQTATFTMPAGAGAVRVQVRVRDADGTESVVTRNLTEAPAVLIAQAKESGASLTAGNSSSTNAPTEISEAIQTLQLAQNQPNPCTRETEIAFALPEAEHVRLSLYDALGREVMTALDEHMRAGTHRITLTLENLPSGVYSYRLRAGNRVAVRTLILAK
jgi:hypothetical protein